MHETILTLFPNGTRMMRKGDVLIFAHPDYPPQCYNIVTGDFYPLPSEPEHAETQIVKR